MRTLDAIALRNGLRFPHKTALRMDERRLTWAELDARVNRVACAFAAVGLAPGDRVAVLAGNCPELIELYLGCARAGVIAVPLNFRLTPRELSAILNQGEPRLFVVADAYVDQARAVEGSVTGIGARWVIGDGALDGATSYENALAAASSAPRRSPATADETFAIFFTSGTTGPPKGAMVSHANLEANAWNQFVADGSRAQDVNLIGTPLYHMGAVFMAVTYMMLGCTQVVMPRFAPELWLRTLERERATVALLIPTMLNSVLNDPRFEQFDRSSLRLVFYGGGPMPPAVLERALARLQCGFTQGYGLTETLEATFLVGSDHVLGGTPQQRARLASAGREAVGAEVRIVDDAGRDLGSGEVGEVLVRSRSVVRGYWRMPEASAEAIRDGWFFTGDLGYLDEDRYLFIVDRKTDMVVSGGVNIYTKEIEAVLYTHPAILEAAVIGLPDEQWGEIVTATIVIRPGTQVTAEALIDYCRRELAGYKKPRRVYFLDELPKNPSGKILKRELRKALGA
ncbi:MAG: long-chain-fatty-acid--CoA ligase [Gammaproteobacteria bacterium]|nr:long-chain-fatty-acid--CoA ligase [Gammaproteobacteria bacterium]